jgi:hypothetical protein
VKNWRVEIKLRDGETTGRMKLPDFDCAGDLTVLSASDQVLLLAVKEKQDRQNQCADAARIQITLTDSDNATFLWQDDNDATNQATGDLSKQ